MYPGCSCNRGTSRRSTLRDFSCSHIGCSISTASSCRSGRTCPPGYTYHSCNLCHTRSAACPARTPCTLRQASRSRLDPYRSLIVCRHTLCSYRDPSSTIGRSNTTSYFDQTRKSHSICLRGTPGRPSSRQSPCNLRLGKRLEHLLWVSHKTPQAARVSEALWSRTIGRCDASYQYLPPLSHRARV